MVDLAEVSANVLLTSKLCVELQNGHLVAIQRKIAPENAFEVSPEVTIPLNCKPPASSQPLTTLETVTSTNPLVIAHLLKMILGESNLTMTVLRKSFPPVWEKQEKELLK